MDMNKIICPHCKNVNILNNHIKSCTLKCPCCGEKITINNCCNNYCTSVYAVIGEFIFAGGIKETRTIKLFKEKINADKYIESLDPFEVLKSYNDFDRAIDDYIESIYSVETMMVE